MIKTRVATWIPSEGHGLGFGFIRVTAWCRHTAYFNKTYNRKEGSCESGLKGLGANFTGYMLYIKKCEEGGTGNCIGLLLEVSQIDYKFTGYDLLTTTSILYGVSQTLTSTVNMSKL